MNNLDLKIIEHINVFMTDEIRHRLEEEMIKSISYVLESIDQAFEYAYNLIKKSS